MLREKAVASAVLRACTFDARQQCRSCLFFSSPDEVDIDNLREKTLEVTFLNAYRKEQAFLAGRVLC